MRRLITVLIVPFLLAVQASAQEPWEGIWVNTDYHCGDSSAKDHAVRISRTEMEGPAYSCRILKVSKTGQSSWALSMRCADGGKAKDAVQILILQNSGHLIRRDRGDVQQEMARCDSLSESARAAIRDRRKFLGCEASGCKLTANEWANLDTAIAWALGKPTPEDADFACHQERNLQDGTSESQTCLKEQSAKPPIKITANCAEGSTTVSGVPYKISDAARDGVIRRGDEPGYWDTTKPYAMPSRSTVAMMSTWFRVLCPSKNVDWNMAPGN